jgi:hypothetical protein
MNRLVFKGLATGTILNVAAPLVVAMLTITGTSSATPITLAFDATVTDVDVLISPFQLPLPVAVGDIIHGRFSFDAPPSGNFSQQQTPLQFHIGKTTLKSSNYEIIEEYNTFPPSNTAVWFIDGSNTPIDSLLIDCSPLGGSCGKVEVTGSTDVEWSASIGRSGPSPILTGLKSSGNETEWNALANGLLWINFFNRFGAAAVGATVGPMVAIPEPPSLVLFLSILLGIAQIPKG